MSLIGNAEFVSETGDINHEHFITLTTRGIKSISLIVEAFDSNGDPVNFPPGTTYAIDVSNSYEPREGDKFSYYNVMIKKENWIRIRRVRLPSTSSTCNNGWHEHSISPNEASILHFTYVRFWVDAIPSIKISLTASSR